MPWKQTNTPYLEQDLVVDGLGDWLGWCLAVTEVAGGTNRLYGYAWEAWCSEVSHGDYNLPEGCWVPIYWDGWWNGGRYGHIAWGRRVGDNLQYAASAPYTHKPYFDYFEGELYSTIAKITSIYGMSSFAGWSETLAGVRFVEWGEGKLEPYQRQVDSVPISYRTGPSKEYPFMDPSDPYLDAGRVCDFKGYVHGENITGNDIWYVGAYTGGYAWSGGFTSQSTDGLPEMVTALPETQLESHQRIVGSVPTPYRTYPSTSSAFMNPDDGYLNANAICDFKGYVHGQAISGIDIWFVGAYSGGYAWAGDFTDPNVGSLRDLGTPVTPTQPEPREGLWFVDVSAHQGTTINWSELKAGGWEGVIIKSGHTGISYAGVQPYNIDPPHDRWAAEARAEGLLIGHYWYCYQELDPVVEAICFCMSDIRDGEPLFIDAEEKDLTEAWVKAFAEKIFELKGATAIYYDYTSNLQNKTWVKGNVWQGEYGRGEGNYVQVRDLKVIMHQYSSTTTAPGVRGNVDKNKFYGTEADWKAFGAWKVQPTDPKPEDPTPEPPMVDDTPNWFIRFIQALAAFLTGLFKKKE